MFGKKRHYAVPHEFVNITPVITDDWPHSTEVGVYKTEVFLWRQALGNRGERTDIREHDAHLDIDLVTKANIQNAVLVEVGKKLGRYKPLIGLCQLDLPCQRKRLHVIELLCNRKAEGHEHGKEQNADCGRNHKPERP